MRIRNLLALCLLANVLAIPAAAGEGEAPPSYSSCLIGATGDRRVIQAEILLQWNAQLGHYVGEAHFHEVNPLAPVDHRPFRVHAWIMDDGIFPPWLLVLNAPGEPRFIELIGDLVDGSAAIAFVGYADGFGDVALAGTR